MLERLLFACLILGLSCGDGGSEPGQGSRSYRMGFSAFPPRPDLNAVLQGLDLWPRRADIAIVHEQLPWKDLVAGVPADSIVRRDKEDLVRVFRSKGLALVFVADPTDGLGRDKEAPDLVALGRSITEPAIQQLYQDYVSAFVRRLSPEYVALAAETNLIRAIAPRSVYAAVVAMANRAAQTLAAESPHPTLFVSVQVEVAWGKLVDGPYRGVEEDFRDFPFVEALGLSSYPYFAWPTPASLPNDYYSRLRNGRTLPVLVVEGGWLSQPVGSLGTSPERQAEYIARQGQLLSSVAAVAYIQLPFPDIDLPFFADHDRALLEPFATLGLVDAQFRAKPALAAWDSLFALPRR